MIELEHKWRFRQNHAVKFEPVDGAEDWRQIEALAPKGNHPIHLDYAGKNLPAWKMAVEIKQIALRDELEHGVLCGLLDQPSARLCSERPLSFKQSDELGIGCFALGVDRQ